MSMFGGSDSAVKQTTTNTPQTVSDQGVALNLGKGGTLGSKNSGNTTIKIGKGGRYAPIITYTSDSGLREEFDAWRVDVNAALNRTPDAGTTVGTAINDRLTGQVTDAPGLAKKDNRNMIIMVVSIIVVAAFALVFGRKN